MRFSGLAAQMLNHRMQLVKFPEGFQVAHYGVFQVALRLLMGLAKYGHGKIFRDAVKNSLFLPYSAQNRDFHDNFGGLLFPQESHNHISLRPTCPCSLRCIGALSPPSAGTLRPMHLAAVSRRIDHRQPVTEVALGADRKYRRWVAFHMLGTNIVCGEQRDELRRGSGLFDVGTTSRFLALHQAQYTGDLESKLTRRLNGLDGRTSRGAHVIHNHNARRLLPKAFNALAHAVRFLRFAHQKAMHWPSLLRADDGSGHHDRIGTHGHPANRIGAPAALANLFEDGLPG